uniref:LysR substrate-binding domain-containing protein n=1 Tax=uncultured Altererythrobacter sp. TaxID=500840 RepID=UPI002609914C|nr:LysR substrate-binding domain-containing protein [uncultured Altererythrobacter sp.]
MIPTQHALTLAPEVSATLMRLKTLIATGTGFDPATSKRRFQINASDYITTVLLVPLIEELQSKAPGVRLNLSLPSSQSAKRLEAGEIDLLMTPDEFLETNHPRELLFEEGHVVVGAADNPALVGTMSISTFLECGHVAVRISNQDTYIEAILKKLAPERRIEVAAQSFIQVPWLIRGTNRLTVMHERLAKVTQSVFDLRIVDSPYDLPLMREMMQYHVSRSGDAGLTWLREQIHRFAKMA